VVVLVITMSVAGLTMAMAGVSVAMRGLAVAVRGRGATAAMRVSFVAMRIPAVTMVVGLSGRRLTGLPHLDRFLPKRLLRPRLVRPSKQSRCKCRRNNFQSQRPPHGHSPLITTIESKLQ
jgi:hypothetical protein